jgi:hypothetical protein
LAVRSIVIGPNHGSHPAVKKAVNKDVRLPGCSSGRGREWPEKIAIFSFGEAGGRPRTLGRAGLHKNKLILEVDI